MALEISDREGGELKILKCKRKVSKGTMFVLFHFPSGVRREKNFALLILLT